MKTLIGYILIAVLFSILVLESEFSSMAKSGLQRDFSWSWNLSLQVSEGVTPDDLLFRAFRKNRPEAWFDSSRKFQLTMRKCLFAGLLNIPDLPGSGVPSIAYYDRFILNAGAKNNIDPALIKALIWRESRFNHIALGEKGEIGLMQIMPGESAAAADWAIAHSRTIPSEEELFSPELNIEIGAWYLSRALKRYRGCRDALALALCEYNAGPGRTVEWIPNPDVPDESVFDLITISSTKKYVHDILNRYEYYKNELNPERNL